MTRLLHINEGAAAPGRTQPSRTFRWTGSPLLDAVAVDASEGHLLALAKDGSLHVLDLLRCISRPLCTLDLPELAPGDDGSFFGAPAYRLHASADGGYAAVVIDQGDNGLVVDTRSGTVTLRLDGGTYYENTVPFSACFLRWDGRDVFVHRTDWNRLEATAPATGQALTERHIAPYEQGGERPAHDLDYFHGRLLPSPEGTRVFDDGWVWHPVSVPRVWSVTTWLATNPFESEDGASIVDLGMRDDWTQPTCWIDERRIARWWPADEYDDECEDVPDDVKGKSGVRIFDVTQSRPAMTNDWPLLELASVSALFSDGTHLVVVTPDGTAVRDIATRAVVADHPGFAARLLDLKRNALLAFSSDTIEEIALPSKVRTG